LRPICIVRFCVKMELAVNVENVGEDKLEYKMVEIAEDVPI
jgi:hypothetical protein